MPVSFTVLLLDLFHEDSMKPAAFLICALFALTGCAAQSVRVADRAEVMRAKLGVVLQDGSWRYEYAVRSGADPLESHTLAEGRIENGKRAGKWSFYYSDGKRFMRGAYDSSGRRQGLWLLWKPDGSLSDERFGLHCDGSRMAWRRPATTSCLALECPSSVQTQGRSSA